jgi:hypothetical protein
VSSSSAKTSSSQQQTTDTQNLNLQSSSGVNVVGSSGVTVSDQGAIKAGVDIGKAAINLGQSGIDAGVGVANAGLDAAQAAYSGSLSLAGQAIASANTSADNVARYAVDAIDENSDLAKTLTGQNTSFATDLFNSVVSALSAANSQAIGGETATLDQALSSNATLAQQVSQSSQQSINDAVVKLVTVIAIAGAAVLIFKGAK